jgi:carboxylesterase type B
MLAAELGKAGEMSVERLRDIPSADIVRLTSRLNQTYTGLIVDGHVVPRVRYQVFASGEQHKVPLIIGSTTRDSVPTRVPLVDVKGAIEKTYGAIADRAIALYGVGDSAQPNPDPLYGISAEQWASDVEFRCPAVAQAIWHASAANRVYQYEFGRVPRGREAVGAPHSSELPYLFGTFTAPGEFATAVYDATDTPVRYS